MRDIELSEIDIKKAIKDRWCPFCGGVDFFATFDLAGRDFCFDKKGNIEWGKRDRDNIEAVECNICSEEIPSEIWKEWFKGTMEE